MCGYIPVESLTSPSEGRGVQYLPPEVLHCFLQGLLGDHVGLGIGRGAHKAAEEGGGGGGGGEGGGGQIK